MISFDLFTTRKVGAPVSLIFPFHVTSIIRAVPLASHGFANEPTPSEPSGQSWWGSGAALATGGVEGVGAGGGALLAGSGLGAGSAFSQPASEMTVKNSSFERFAVRGMASDVITKSVSVSRARPHGFV